MNEIIAKLLRELGTLSDLDGQKQRKFAYNKAASVIEFADCDVREVDPTSLTGIGDKISLKIKEMISTGTCSKLEELRKKWKHIIPLLEISGIGPAKAKKIYNQWKVTSKEEIVELIDKGIIKDKRIIEGVTREEKRVPYNVAKEISNNITKHLKEKLKISKIESCGSLRRHEETIGDIDIIICTEEKGKALVEAKKLIDKTDAEGDSKISGTINGVHVDFRVVDEEHFGSMLLYFTGNTEFNIELRKIASSRGLLLNEYGVWDGKNNLASKTEKEMFDILNISWVSPESRYPKNIQRIV